MRYISCSIQKLKNEKYKTFITTEMRKDSLIKKNLQQRSFVLRTSGLHYKRFFKACPCLLMDLGSARYRTHLGRFDTSYACLNL